MKQVTNILSLSLNPLYNGNRGNVQPTGYICSDTMIR